MTKSTTRIKADVAGIAGRKNLIINGGFDVWQRGTSFANPLSNSYMADRFFTGGTRAATTITKNTGVSVNGKVVNTLRFDATGADSWDFYQGIEDYNAISEQTVTISFWYKTNLAGVVCRHYSTSTYGSPLNSDSTWRKFETTVTLPTLIGAGAGANKTSFGWWAIGTAPSAGSFLEVAMFQLELGSVATDFEHRSYGEELALCQRYYERINGTSPWFFGHGYNSQVYMTVEWKVPKRVSGGTVYYSDQGAPASMFTLYGNTGSSGAIDGVITSVSLSNAAVTALSFYLSLSSPSNTPYGTSVMWRLDGARWIAYDAEL